MFKNRTLRNKRGNKSETSSVNSSPCKRINDKVTQPWAVLSARDMTYSEVKMIDLVNDTEEVRYNQLLNNEFSEQVIFTFSYNLDYNLICYFDGVYLNQSPLDKGKQYKFKNDDELNIKLRDDKQIKLDIQIKMEQSNKIIKDIKDNLTCMICDQVYSSPITLTPCFHTFCGKCIAQNFASELECPTCNQKVTKIYKNDVLSQIVHKLVLNNNDNKPIQIKPKQEPINIQQLKKMINKYFDSNEMQEISQCVYEISFKRNRPVIKSIEPVVNYNGEYKQVILNSNGKGNDKSFKINVDLESYNKYNKYKDQDIVPIHSYKCTYCLPVDSQPSRYLCGRDENHAICNICEYLFPKELKKGNNNNQNNNCELCHTDSCPSCDSILKGLGIALESKAWNLYEPQSFPLKWFDGNSIDSQIFQNYINYHGLTPTTLYQSIIKKLKNKEIIIQDLKYKNLKWDKIVCEHCINHGLFNELAFQYRAQMTNEELQMFQKDTSIKRQNCYYGRACTGRFDTIGQEEFNHACHPCDEYYTDNYLYKHIYKL
ncbi:hypothetical protein K502DRAFT_357220 [Neoconidiobolus thromboides FSU 785]|nr:hypothetical protein K502DRAFT_357220 [Neoconidiobolus thromboides FSU 785]